MNGKLPRDIKKGWAQWYAPGILAQKAETKGSEVQGWPELLAKFEVSLSYMRTWVGVGEMRRG